MWNEQRNYMNREFEDRGSTATDINAMCQKLLDTLKGMYWQLVPENFVIFDLETTGLTPRTDTILEIGAIAVNKAKFLETGEVEGWIATTSIDTF